MKILIASLDWWITTSLPIIIGLFLTQNNNIYSGIALILTGLINIPFAGAKLDKATSIINIKKPL